MRLSAELLPQTRGVVEDFDVEAAAARGMAFEQLDQLAMDHLLGVWIPRQSRPPRRPARRRRDRDRRGHLQCKTNCLTLQSVADTITIRTDEETEHALDVLTRDGISRSAAMRQAVLEAANRRERAAQMRREVLRTDLGQPDGIDVAEELARDRSDER